MRALVVLALSALWLWGCPPKPPKQAELGDPLLGLSEAEKARFEAGKTVFERVFTPEDGLGPLFNGNSCGECHEAPVSGGVGDEVEVHGTLFVSADFCDPLFDKGGPVFQLQATPLLQAKGIFKEDVPAGADQGQRSTPPIFGFGLVDGIPEAAILAHEDPADSDGDGISGRANRFLDGRLGRFGRKAFVPTLFEFNAGAFPFEQGVTTPLSPVEETIGGQPVPPDTDPAADPEIEQADIDAVTDFTRFLAPPPRVFKQGAELDVVKRGEALFSQTGCAKCHIPAMKTGPSEVPALDQKVVYLYSDLLLHDMGPELADICLGLASRNEFRTEMLMGLRFREKFLHDGSAASVEEAIERHGGEGEAARDAFQNLRPDEKKALLQFLQTI